MHNAAKIPEYNINKHNILIFNHGKQVNNKLHWELRSINAVNNKREKFICVVGLIGGYMQVACGELSYWLDGW